MPTRRLNSKIFRHRWAPAAVLFVGFALSIYAASVFQHHQAERRESIFREDARKKISAFAATLNQHLYILTAIDSFYGASTDISRGDFANFVEPFLKKDPEISNLQWIPRIETSQREIWESAGAVEVPGYEFRELDSRGRLRRAGSRAEYFPVYYAEPQSKNLSILGFDHGSDPTRLDAIERARASGMEIVTPGLLSEGEVRQSSHDILILRPIYRKENTGREFAGIIAGLYNILDVFRTAMEGLDPGSNLFRIRDTVTGESILNVFDSGEMLPDGSREEVLGPHEWHLTEHIDFCDRRWEVTVIFSGYSGAGKNWGAWLVFSGCVTLALIVFGYLTLLTREADNSDKNLEHIRQSADALRESEERSRSIIETANDAFVSIDAQGKIRDWNPRAEAIFGWKKSEVIGAVLGDTIIPGAYRKAHAEGLQRYLRTGEGKVLKQLIELTALRRGGEEFPIEITIWASHAGRAPMFNAFIRDISQRKHTEEKVNARGRYLDLTRRIALTANQTASAEDAIRVCVEEVCKLMNWPAGHVFYLDEPSGRLISSHIWYLDRPERFESFRKISEAITFAPGQGMPGRILESKKPVWIRDVTKDLNFPRANATANIEVRGGMGFPVMIGGNVKAIFEFFSDKPQDPIEELSDVMAQVGDSIGRSIERERAERQLREALDKTRKAHEDLKRTQTQLIQADRLSAIGQLAAGVAHEINNPVSFVNSNLSTLHKYSLAIGQYADIASKAIESALRGRDAEEIRRLSEEAVETGKRVRLDFILKDIEPLIAESQSGLDRVKKIVLDLKTFTRADSREGMDLVDVNEVIDSAVGVVWNELKYKAEVVKDFGKLPKVFCNPQQLGQVFINMLVNAAQAIRENGTITLRTRPLSDSVAVDIEDTGEGIPSDIMDKIFDPFFTTKEVGKGTGLGLGISYDIIKKHSGRIEVSSVIGKGTKFTVYLPMNLANSCPLP